MSVLENVPRRGEVGTALAADGQGAPHTHQTRGRSSAHGTCPTPSGSESYPGAEPKPNPSSRPLLHHPGLPASLRKQKGRGRGGGDPRADKPWPRRWESAGEQVGERRGATQWAHDGSRGHGPGASPERVYGLGDPSTADHR